MSVFTRDLSIDQGCDFTFTTWPWVVGGIVQDLRGTTCKMVLYGDDGLAFLTISGIVPNDDGTVTVSIPNASTIALPTTKGPLKHDLFNERPGAVIGIAMTNIGSGYTTASVALTGGGGTDATATATIADGSVVKIDVTDPGHSYSSAPAVGITGDGASAAATASVGTQTTLLQSGRVFVTATVGSV